MKDIAMLMKYHPAIYSVILYLLGHGSARTLIYISKKMPPLPEKSGFWSKWVYDMMKGASGLDPNASLVSSNFLKAAGLTPDQDKGQGGENAR